MSVQIEVENCSKNFQEVGAVKGVSFSIYKGEFLAILGPSGCGKSTLLRCIAGLEDPDEGRISIAGEYVFSTKESINISTEKRGASLVFQNYALWPHYNIFNNVAYPLKIRKRPKEEIKKKVEKLLSLVNIKDKTSRYPHELSGGEQQRVALARALIMEPDVLLLDEPLSNLDAKLREDMQTELVRIKNKLNLTVVHVTHDQNEAMELADRIIVMNNGIIEQIGTPKEIYDKPCSIFVASFIGKTNIIRRNETKQKGESLYEVLMTKFDLNNGKKIVISVRPEDIKIENKIGSLKAEILRVIYHGNITRYIVKYKDNELLIDNFPNEFHTKGDSVYFNITKVLVLKE